jgi:hypothetical protein
LFVILLNTEVQVLSYVDVFLGDFRLFLVIFVLEYFDFECTEYFAECAGVVVEEGLAEVVEVLGREIDEPVELVLLDLLEDVLVVKRAVELGLGLATGYCGPLNSLDQRLDEVVLRPAVEPTQRLEFLCEKHLDLVLDLRDL